MSNIPIIFMFNIPIIFMSNIPIILMSNIPIIFMLNPCLKFHVFVCVEPISKCFELIVACGERPSGEAGLKTMATA